MTREEIIGDARLLLGDCREILPALGKVDAVVTDPPYGIGAANGSNSGGMDASGRYQRRPRQYAGDWDGERADNETLALVLAIAPAHIIWGGNFFTDVLPIGGRWLAWDKLNSMPTFSDLELAWTSIAGGSVKKFTQCASGLAANRDGREHPTQKPVALMDWCLTFLPSANTVIDPFMGVASTGVACVGRGLQFTGIERDPEYFDIACRRIDEAYKQPRLFTDKPAPPTQLALLDGAA